MNQNPYTSAMQGYQGYSSKPQGQSNPLGGIISTALNILPFVIPEIGIPARMALGAAAAAGGNAIDGQPMNLGQDLISGASNGLMGGMMGGGAKAAEGVASKVAADAAASDAATIAAKDATSVAAKDAASAGTNAAESGLAKSVASDVPTVATPTVATPTAGIAGETNPSVGNLLGEKQPTSIDPMSNTGHVNLNKDANGNPIIDNNNTFVSPTETPINPPTSGTPSTPSTPPTTQTTPQPAPNTGSPTSMYMPQDLNTQPQLGGAQAFARNEAVAGMRDSLLANGVKIQNADANRIANMALDAGYNDIPTMAKHTSLMTGSNVGIDNSVNNMVHQASIGDSLNNPTAFDVSHVLSPDARTSLLNEATRGTNGYNKSGSPYSLEQRKTIGKMVQNQNERLAGAGAGGNRTIQQAVESGDLVRQGGKDGGYELSANALRNVLPANLLQVQKNFAKLATDAQSAGEQQLFTSLSNNLKDQIGQIAITKEGAQNVLDNLAQSGFDKEAPAQFAKLQQGLKDGTIKNVQQLRSFTAPWVNVSQAYSKATGGASSFDLLAGGRGGLSKNLMSSNTASKLRVKGARAVSKFTAKPGAPTAFGESNASIPQSIKSNGTGGSNTMSPLGKALLAAGIGGAGLVGVNGIATANQGAQAQAQLNDPTNQATQNILDQSNQLQRYLGQQGEIRSIFAPTFDANAGQAGTMGQAMLTSANNNQAARQAAQELLMARAGMGQGGILGGIASLIPGTPENAYKQRAANAQAQLNALGVAGTAPGVMQSGAGIPSLTSMAGNVGNF